jgi:hypothetical protein
MGRKRQRKLKKTDRGKGELLSPSSVDWKHEKNGHCPRELIVWQTLRPKALSCSLARKWPLQQKAGN